MIDGNCGVLAALKVLHTLNGHQIQNEAPLEVAFWTNKAGSRFAPVMMGSGVFCEAFGLAEHEGVSSMRADYEIDLQTARLHLWHAAWLLTCTTPSGSILHQSDAGFSGP